MASSDTSESTCGATNDSVPSRAIAVRASAGIPEPTPADGGATSTAATAGAALPCGTDDVSPAGARGGGGEHCFICFDNAPPLHTGTLCACTSTSVHLQCLGTWLNRSEALVGLDDLVMMAQQAEALGERAWPWRRAERAPGSVESAAGDAAPAPSLAPALRSPQSAASASPARSHGRTGCRCEVGGNERWTGGAEVGRHQCGEPHQPRGASGASARDLELGADASPASNANAAGDFVHGESNAEGQGAASELPAADLANGQGGRGELQGSATSLPLAGRIPYEPRCHVCEQPYRVSWTVELRGGGRKPPEKARLTCTWAAARRASQVLGWGLLGLTLASLSYLVSSGYFADVPSDGPVSVFLVFLLGIYCLLALAAYIRAVRPRGEEDPSVKQSAYVVRILGPLEDSEATSDGNSQAQAAEEDDEAAGGDRPRPGDAADEPAPDATLPQPLKARPGGACGEQARWTRRTVSPERRPAGSTTAGDAQDQDRPTPPRSPVRADTSASDAAAGVTRGVISPRQRFVLPPGLPPGLPPPRRTGNAASPSSRGRLAASSASSEAAAASTADISVVVAPV